MSRAIEFRAWSGAYMEYGGFSVHATGKIEPFPGLTRVTAESPLMQFTGLTDKNGVKIFEGDIIYLAGYGNYVAEFPFITLYDSAAEGDAEEVIGNIYENPELLEQKP